MTLTLLLFRIRPLDSLASWTDDYPRWRLLLGGPVFSWYQFRYTELFPLLDNQWLTMDPYSFSTNKDDPTVASEAHARWPLFIGSPNCTCCWFEPHPFLTLVIVVVCCILLLLLLIVVILLLVLKPLWQFVIVPHLLVEPIVWLLFYYWVGVIVYWLLLLKCITQWLVTLQLLTNVVDGVVLLAQLKDVVTRLLVCQTTTVCWTSYCTACGDLYCWTIVLLIGQPDLRSNGQCWLWWMIVQPVGD